MSEYQRKYEKGAQITSIGQFAASGSKWFILGDKPKHRSFVESMQYRTVANLIRAGRLYEALPAGLRGKEARTAFAEEYTK